VVTLTEEERSHLRGLVSRGKSAARKLLHAQILLKADSSPGGAAWTDGEIIAAFAVSRRTVERVRERFVEEGLESALARKEQKKRRAPKVDGEAEAYLVATACSKPPAGRQRWTLRLLADRLVELEFVDTISLETVRQSLKKTPQAVVERDVVSGRGTERGICLQDGGCSFGL